MTQVDQDFELFAGDDKLLVYTIYDENGSIVNLTGITSAQWVMKKYAKDTTQLVLKTLSSGIAVVSATDGTISVTLSSTNTQSLTPGEYYYELRIKDASSKTGTVSIGKVMLMPTDDL